MIPIAPSTGARAALWLGATLLAIFLLAACAPGPAPRLFQAEIITLDVPRPLVGCPKPKPIADPPKPPRTIEQVMAAYSEAIYAGRANADGLKECGFRNKRMRDWIAANQVVPGDINLDQNGDLP